MKKFLLILLAVFTMMIVDYRILGHRNPHELAKQVRTYLSQGWQPYGPMVYDGGVLMQPIVKYRK